jgi:hypothetical protein
MFRTGSASSTCAPGGSESGSEHWSPLSHSFWIDLRGSRHVLAGNGVIVGPEPEAPTRNVQDAEPHARGDRK